MTRNGVHARSGALWYGGTNITRRARVHTPRTHNTLKVLTLNQVKIRTTHRKFLHGLGHGLGLAHGQGLGHGLRHEHGSGVGHGLRHGSGLVLGLGLVLGHGQNMG